MTTRDEIEQEIDELLIAAYGEGSAHSMLRVMLDPVGKERLHEKASRCSIEKREAKSRLLALLSPARPDGDVTIVLSRKQAETASFAARYTASHLRHYPKDAELMNAITTVIEAAIAAAHDRPGGEEATA